MAVRILQNEQLAEEVAQDSFLNAYKALKTFEAKSKFITWLYRITYNVALNALKKENRINDFISDQEPEDYVSNSSSNQINDSTLDNIVRNDNGKIVREFVAKLPSKFASILTMYHLNQMKYDEISELMDIPIGTVKSHIHRGRILLKTLILENYNKQELI
ncbi:RNA polymerase sigma factor [Candidatus Marinimicrobia bacterium MT.SAG.4]|nr:RNA polymerase sigma factor [Candidatus Marinimicrobia bacterium MT.SAG.4]